VRLEIARERELKGSEVILVVEDDPDVRRSVRESLEQYHYSVLEAEDGADALRLMDLLNAPPDLLLTDVVMPEVGGRELIDVLGREGKLPKVLLMSGYTDTTLEKAMPANNHPFIAKPFTHEELAIRVRDVLESNS
jgi:CheY-like chemotaxis protein